MNDKEIVHLQSEQIDIKSVLTKYLRYWYLFLAGSTICIAIAYVYLRYATPQYTISSTLLIRDNGKSTGGSSANAIFRDLDLFKPTANLENEIEVLKSKSLMQRVLTELDLNIEYYEKGKIKNREIYGRDVPLKIIVGQLDSTAYDKTITILLKDNTIFEIEEENKTLTTHHFGEQIQKPYGTFTAVPGSSLTSRFSKKPLVIKFQNIQKIANEYHDKVKIEPINKVALVITISLKDAVPEKGIDIINKLLELYNKEALEDKNILAANTKQFVDDRLKHLTGELANVEKDVESFKRKNEIADVSSQAQLYVEEASNYSKKINEWSIQIDILESIENYLTKAGSQLEMVPSTLGIEDPTLLGLIKSFNDLQLERERMLRTAQPNNPIVQNMDSQLDNLRTNILENLKNIKNGLIITRNNLQASSGQSQSKIQKVPFIERELLEINRQQSIKQALYLYLLQKREESALTLAATVSSSRIIDPAIADSKPASPIKALIYLIALAFGIGLPFVSIYLKDLLNNKIQHIKDIEMATAIPILGEISHNNSDKVLVATEKNRAPIAEFFRLLRINLQFLSAGKENKVIMITSGMSGEGKTFISINLGATLALTGKKVVILEFDLRSPSLLEDMELPYSNGITNYLISNELSVYDIINPSQTVEGLYMIGSGSIPPNPAELMLGDKVGQLIEELREKFDYIIIDTAPIGKVADAFTLNKHIDSTIYLVRYNYTAKADLQLVDKIYTSKKLKNPMIVLNDTKKENSYGYGYNDKKAKSKKEKTRIKAQPSVKIEKA